MSTIRINSIMENPSLCDGVGYRTVVFLQGCNFHCPGCHNQSTWDVNGGKEIEIDELAQILKKKAFNKKITISGGEPLLQKEKLILLFDKLKDFDICLYTGYSLNEIPEEILKSLRFVKVGRFKKELWTSTKPYVGSINQDFIEVKNYGKTE